MHIKSYYCGLRSKAETGHEDEWWVGQSSLDPRTQQVTCNPHTISASSKTGRSSTQSAETERDLHTSLLIKCRWNSKRRERRWGVRESRGSIHTRSPRIDRRAWYPGYQDFLFIISKKKKRDVHRSFLSRVYTELQTTEYRKKNRSKHAHAPVVIYNVQKVGGVKVWS